MIVAAIAGNPQKKSVKTGDHVHLQPKMLSVSPWSFLFPALLPDIWGHLTPILRFSNGKHPMFFFFFLMRHQARTKARSVGFTVVGALCSHTVPVSPGDALGNKSRCVLRRSVLGTVRTANCWSYKWPPAHLDVKGKRFRIPRVCDF